ncbi:MAG TPA: ABC transporter permease [Polyangiaceae bacterium]
MSAQSKGVTSSVPPNEPLARILGVRKPLDAKARLWIGILAFVLPFLAWCAVSYVPFIWHPQVLVVDAGDTRVPGENSYIAVGDRVDLDVVILRNRELDAAHARRVSGERVNPIYLQAPHAVARAMYTAFTTAPERDGDAWLHESLLQSCKVIFWGFFWSAVFGLPLGVLCGTFPFFARLFEPFIDFVRYMPAPVFGALALTVLGLNDAPKITIIFIGTFFQMVLIVSNTTRSVEVSLLHAAQTLGANKRQLVWNVVVPGAVPGLYRDMRILIGWAWTYLVVAELIGEKSGLSAWLYQQQRYRHFDNVYAAIVIIGLVGLFTDQFLALLGRYLFPWETGQTGLARALRAMRRALPLRTLFART